MPRRRSARAKVTVLLAAVALALAVVLALASPTRGEAVVAVREDDPSACAAGNSDETVIASSPDSSENVDSKVEVTPENVNLSTEQVDMLERVLYGLPQPDVRLPSGAEKARMSPEEYKAALAKVWMWRQEEVRKAMESLDDEASIMRRLAGTIANASMDKGSPELLEALADAEDWVSELDHATHFGALGGVQQCVALMGGHADAEVRTAAAYAVGSAIKNKPDLQMMALESGLVQIVRSRLEDELAPCAASAPDKARECGKMLYALSSLVRGHPVSQAQVIEQGLLEVLAQLLAHDYIDPRVLVKVGAFVYDSFTEWPVCPAQWSKNGTSTALCENLEHQAENIVAGAYASQPQHLRQQVGIKVREALQAAKCAATGLPTSFFESDE
ncbi:Hsp70 nucleotide exchange factor FES1 [Hondaea fermentalgiana]|uniref:Hsp70 nucleotide exchange factor FES1 n=1 Tax=Hondaea fermentalgiana TaxID=2315210 RepID=A0A2R5GIR4_9STRA|nr:Hsp70 nucleotide exchange factor FES1 [Hondaea fermentalgiana]|eukprot:GBG30495.1 Hsp70 nucleotide exchange factor FES1 [Hondaea fermentalgiana]